jgi:pyruvate dehydrogenase E2 component (dihydrolipoamide acetyltransferase)
MFGIDHFTAVLNPPAAGILAVGQTKRVPIVDADGELRVGQRMTVTLTCDHRAVDGAVGAVFLQRFARYMETPLLLA